MPLRATQHPDDFDLVAYAGGKLRSRDRGPIEGHLADCAQCVTRLDALMRQAKPDPLLRRLRAAGGSNAVADTTPLPGSLAAESWLEVVRQLAGVPHPNLLMPQASGAAVALPPGGIDLHAVACAENRPAVAVVCDYARQAADGLGAAHARGVTHGDLRLADLLLFDQVTVRVTGFHRYRLWSGSPPAAPAADIAALGRCFAALLSGRAYRAGLASSPEAGLEKSLPPDVYRVLSRFAADAPKPFATMAEVAAALAAISPPPEPRRAWWQRLFAANR